ncbi:MAG: nitrogenase [Symploca sp. SIO2B6]|nr:nitrogenase [Symploca sp. SIO2B6]
MSMPSSALNSQSAMIGSKKLLSIDLLAPIRQWMDNFEINDPTIAHRFARFIPSQCPFERNVNFLGRTLFHIPPLCKLNPLYEQMVGLRFRSLCYLADTCGEDIQAYL